MDDADRTVRLFSYGTLRQPEVQRATFGRLVEGRPDAIVGFRLEVQVITDPVVVAASGTDQHPILIPVDDADAVIDGTVFEITPDELEAADEYEVDAYERIEVPLRSGGSVWVYVLAGQDVSTDGALDGELLRERLRALDVFAVQLPDFRVEDAPAHPAALFSEWLLAAIDAGVREPHAMTLSTVDDAGRPSARVLILKGLDDGRWEFATSRTSRKGEELATQPWAAITFYWREQGRQVRLRGRVMDAGAEASARDYLARPSSSRGDGPDVVDEQWTLYHVIPDEVEFWQADRERRHIRLQYRLVAGRWQHERLRTE